MEEFRELKKKKKTVLEFWISYWIYGEMEELREREIALLNDEVEVGKKKRMAELSKKDAIWQNLVLSHMRSLLIYIYIYWFSHQQMLQATNHGKI